MKHFSKQSLSRSMTAVLRCLPAEMAHDIAIWGLRAGYGPKVPLPDVSGMQSSLGERNLDHPIGLAAGFDKNAACIPGLAKLGFSFLEVGTVTPKPQPGNPRPRLFRLPEQNAVINRMGFNNHGVDIFLENFSSGMKTSSKALLVGINCGKNKLTPEESALDDYVKIIEAAKESAGYLVVNLSSPNTPGLRKLASREFLESLASAIGEGARKTWIKLDPDMTRQSFEELIQAICDYKFEGVILTNTHRVEQPEVGGLSGAPLSCLSLKFLEWAHAIHDGKLPMIAVGGIFSGLDVYERILRGASAVQIYTAMIYDGPYVVYRILEELRNEMHLRGVQSLDQIRGMFYER